MNRPPTLAIALGLAMSAIAPAGHDSAAVSYGWHGDHSSYRVSYYNSYPGYRTCYRPYYCEPTYPYYPPPSLYPRYGDDYYRSRSSLTLGYGYHDKHWGGAFSTTIPLDGWGSASSTRRDEYNDWRAARGYDRIRDVSEADRGYLRWQGRDDGDKAAAPSENPETLQRGTDYTLDGRLRPLEPSRIVLIRRPAATPRTIPNLVGTARPDTPATAPRRQNQAAPAAPSPTPTPVAK